MCLCQLTSKWTNDLMYVISLVPNNLRAVFTYVSSCFGNCECFNSGSNGYVSYLFYKKSCINPPRSPKNSGPSKTLSGVPQIAPKKEFDKQLMAQTGYHCKTSTRNQTLFHTYGYYFSKWPDVNFPKMSIVPAAVSARGSERNFVISTERYKIL